MQCVLGRPVLQCVRFWKHATDLQALCALQSAHAGPVAKLRHVCALRATGHGLATVGPLFEYLRLLQAAGPQRWVFDELAAIAQLKFQFAEDEDACELVSRLASDMPLYAPQHALLGPYLHDEWRPDLVREAL